MLRAEVPERENSENRELEKTPNERLVSSLEITTEAGPATMVKKMRAAGKPSKTLR